MKGRGIRAQHNYDAIVYLHLTRREFYRMNPGLYYDLVQIHNDKAPRRSGEEFD